MLSDKENWKTVSNKRDYHFLRTFSEPSKQQLYYIPDCSLLQQASTSNHHFIWNDIQLSKGNMNKDRLIEAEIGDNKEHVYYRCAPCQGVKMCPEKGCTYVAPIREKRGCKSHTQQKLIRSEGCPVELVYILYPQDFKNDNRRWIGGIVRHQKEASKSLHNHKLYGAFKICNLVKDKISSAVHANLSLTPTDISQGSGIGFIPSVVDTASSHLGRVAREVSKIKHALGANTRDWSLEAAVDDIDKDDLQKSDDSQLEAHYKEYGQPYLVSAGVENGINML